MANGLRKLIRKARRFSNPLMTNRRVGKFGTRLKVEELEERIAPAAVTLTPGEFTTYDISAGGGTDGAHDVTDGVFGLSGAAGSDNDLASTVTDVDVTIVDDTTPVITDIDFGALTATETVVIGTNRTIGDLDLGNLTTAFDTTTITTLNLVIIAGNNAADGAAVDELMFDDVTGSDTDYSFDTFVAGTGDDPTDAEVFTGLTTGGIGTITLPTSVHASGLTVNLVVVGGATGTITSIASTATDVTLSSVATTNAAGSVVNAGTITSFSWAGPIDPGAVDIWIDADSNAGSGIGTLTLGAVTLDTASGDLVIDSDGGIGGLTIGAVAATADGDLLIDADDDGGNDDGVTGAVVLGALDIDVAGAAVSIDGGGSGFASTVGIGAIDLATAVNQAVSVTTSSTGGFADLVTASTITNNSTAGGSVSIGPAGAGDMVGFTATGLISNAAAAVTGGITIGGGSTSDLGPLTLVGVTNASTNDGGDITFQGQSIGAITSTVAIQTTGTNGDILFNANGATNLGSMGNLTVAGNIATGAAGALITFQANDDMGSIDVTGNVGGTGAIAFTANNGGTADTGNMGNVEVNNATGTANLGNGTGTVAFSAVDIGTILADNIGNVGAGAVSFTADGLDATDGTGGGLIGTLTVTNDVASTASVTFTADDGMGIVTIGADAAQGAGVTLTFDVNQDATDDTGSMGAISAQSLGNAAGTGNVVIDTNSGATDNTTERGVGAITITDGNGKLSITAAGDVGLISVSGNSGTGNDLDIDLLNLDAAGDGANADIPDFAGINIEDTSTADTLTLGGAWTIPGVIGVGGSPATSGSIIVGGGDAGDVMALGGNGINVYAGDDVADGFDSPFAASSPNDPSVISITAGDITSGGGVITANTKAASDLFTYIKNGETFAVSVASDVTANISFDPDGGSAGEESVAITQLAGTSASDDVTITTSGASPFDVSAISPAVDNVLDVRNITIEGDLIGNIGTAALAFDAVDTIIIQGADNGNQFFGTSLKGYASTDSTLVLTGVDILTLDTAADGTEDLVLIAGSTFNFADSTGATTDVFNHHIGVAAGATGATATIRGIDGAGDSTADAAYLFSGDGASTAQTDINGQVLSNAIDPNDLISGAALISRIMISGVGGIETDAAVRELDGTTNGSFLEFETSVGLVNLTTPLSTISVGIDDGSDLVDNVVSTSIEGADGNTREAKDRLGGGEYSENWLGLNPSESVSDATAALGNFVARSMSQPTNDDDINIVVTGDSGPISLTGKLNLEAGDPGTTGDVDPGGITAADYSDETGAAIAIGGSLQGAISIPGTIDTADSDTEPDILIGIAVDADNDGDYKAGEEPSGSVNAPITIGHAPTTNIVVADDINYDIVVTGYDWHLEESGMDAGGDLNGVKANGDIGQLGEDVIVVAGGLEYVIADGSLNSGIFSGGDGADSVEIEGTTINGPIVLGAVYGIDSLLIIDHEAFGDVGDSDTISGAQMTIQIAAGGIGDGTDAVGDIYVQDSISSINVSTSSGDAIDIGNIFTLDDGSFWVSTPADMGVIVAAEGVNILTSEQLQDLITTTDVVNSPTTLDTANGDDDDYLAYSGYIDAVNAGGVVAEGDIDISDAEILENMGYIVSLHSYIDACVYAGTSIGSIVSSDGIYDSYFESEGTLGVGLGTLAADFGTGGYAESLAGFPDWFLGTGGGVVSEVADIDSSDFIAHGGFEFTGGEGVAAAQAMGTFYVVAGNIDCDSSIISGGSMGGIQAPTGVADMLFQVSMDGNIDRIIVAQWSPASNSNPTLDSYWNSDRVAIFVHGEAGDNIIVASNPLTIDSIDISVTGANTLAIYNSSNDIVLVGGLELGSSLVVNGDIPGGDLVVDGNWAGLVDINPNAETGERGENAIITVTGSVLAGADLDCFNFVSLNVQGTIDSSVLNGGTLSSSNRTDSLTMLDDTSVQTLYLRGASNVTAVWNSVFGKVTGYTASGVSVNGVEFMGKGKADFATDSGSSAISESAMQDFVKAGSVSQGTAHIGDMSLALGSKVNLKNALVPGELDSFTTPNNARNLIVGDNVGTVSVGNVLNNAFIGGNVDDFGARIAKNVVINGSVDDFSAYKITKTSVFGVTDDLTITGNRPRGEGACGSIINSFFLWVNDANFGPTYPQSNVRIVKSVIGGLDEVPDTVYIPWYYS